MSEKKIFRLKIKGNVYGVKLQGKHLSLDNLMKKANDFAKNKSYAEGIFHKSGKQIQNNKELSQIERGALLVSNLDDLSDDEEEEEEIDEAEETGEVSDGMSGGDEPQPEIEVVDVKCESSMQSPIFDFQIANASSSVVYEEPEPDFPYPTQSSPSPGSPRPRHPPPPPSSATPQSLTEYSKEEGNNVVIYQEVKRAFTINLKQVKSNVRSKLINGNPLSNNEKDELLRVYANSILNIDQFVNCEKINVLTMQLVLKFPVLIERDDVGQIRGNGCERLTVSLEMKIDYMRRKNPVLQQGYNRKQMPRKRSARDDVFKMEREMFDGAMKRLKTCTDKKPLKELLKNVYLYQREEICNWQREDPYTAFGKIMAKWKILKDPELAYYNAKLFTGVCIKQQMEQNLSKMTLLAKRLHPTKNNEPHVILVILTIYFKETLHHMFRLKGEEVPEAAEPVPAHPVIIHDPDKGNYSVVIEDFKISNIGTFSSALANFLAMYINFNLQYLPEVACTVQFLHRVVCKIPLVEYTHALHKKKKNRLALMAVLLAEDLVFDTVIPTNGKAKRRRVRHSGANCTSSEEED